MEPQENLAGHFPSSTAHGARLRRHCQPWPHWSGTSRQWLVPAVAPSCSNGGRERLDGRPALPPHDIRCSTVWLAHEQRQQKATWCRWLEPSLPTSMVGGPALETSHRRALRSQRRHWPLPPETICMSAGHKTFPLGVSHGWSPPSQSSKSTALMDIRISS